jgi:hypothetical protein
MNKGKGKAKSFPSGPVIVSSDEENDASFFMSQKPINIRNIRTFPIPIPFSTCFDITADVGSLLASAIGTRRASPEYSESESSGGTVRRRVRKKKTLTKRLPEWTRKESRGVSTDGRRERSKEKSMSGTAADVWVYEYEPNICKVVGLMMN